MTAEQISTIYVALKDIPGWRVKIAELADVSEQHVLNSLGPRDKYTTKPTTAILAAATTVLDDYSTAVNNALASAKRKKLSRSN